MPAKTPVAKSSRALTREHGTFTRVTEGSRSLQRGLQLLRAFSHGADVLGNGELASRTGLPLSTVSRLTNSLVQERFLDYDIGRQGYRLAPVMLSLADAYSRNDVASDTAFPLMKKLAEKERINVGLAVADRLEMVYVTSLRESRRGIFRRGAPGSRFPIELTAGGRGYIAGLSPPAKQALMQQLSEKHGAEWKRLRAEIERGVAAIQSVGYCVAYWAPGMTALGASLVTLDARPYALVVSYHSMDTSKADEARYGGMLVELRDEIQHGWNTAPALAAP